MSNNSLDDKEMFNVLEKLFDDMKKKGAIFDKPKHVIILSVIESLNKASVGLTKDDIKPASAQEHGILHSLKGLLMGENIKQSNKLMTNHPFHQLMDKLLVFLKLKKPEPKPKLTFIEHMKKELAKIFPSIFAKKEDKDKLNKDNKLHSKPTQGSHHKPESKDEAFNNLNSVDKFGNLTYPIMIIGDMIGMTNHSHGGSHDASYMTDRANVNPGEADHHGAENAAMNRVLAIADTSPELEKEIISALNQNKNQDIINPPTPFSTKPKIPGSTK